MLTEIFAQDLKTGMPPNPSETNPGPAMSGEIRLTQESESPIRRRGLDSSSHQARSMTLRLPG